MKRLAMGSFVIGCVLLAGCDLPLAFDEEGASIDMSEYESGPEALSWLRGNRNESALASNRFGETQSATRFVEGLYSAGAKRVIVPQACITNDQDTLNFEGGPYADGLTVTMPDDADKRARVWEICRREIKREGFDPSESAGQDMVFLWWD
jgi:hypothetical protein